MKLLQGNYKFSGNVYKNYNIEIVHLEEQLKYEMIKSLLNKAYDEGLFELIDKKYLVDGNTEYSMKCFMMNPEEYNEIITILKELYKEFDMINLNISTKLLFDKLVSLLKYEK